MPTELLRHTSENSVLVDAERRGLVAFAVGPRTRFATCSGVSWLDNHHLAVANLYGGHVRIYRLEFERDFANIQVKLLHELQEGIAYPETVSATSDRLFLAISHSMSTNHGVSVHPIDPLTLALSPAKMLRVGLAFHGLCFSPDSRHLALTEVGDPGYVEVLSFPEGKTTCMIKNHSAPLKPKDIAFTRDGRFVVIVYAANVKLPSFPSGYGCALSVHRFSISEGIIDPTPLSCLQDVGPMLGAPESCTILPAPPGKPFRILAADQAGDRVSEFEFDPQQQTLTFSGVFAADMTFPHGVDASPNGRLLAVANYGDDTLRILRID